MRTCAFILPYYGKFPNYFQLFLNSCGKNPDYDWLVFTDDDTPYDYPSNVHVFHETFADMQKRVKEHFDFPVVFNKPWKMCDLRPMFGYLFEDYLSEYRFWGHCDCDLVFGKISHFITDDMLDRFEKIFVLGHCSLYRNTYENNRRFMLPLDGEVVYRKVLSSDDAFTFDESWLPQNINRIFTVHGFPVFGVDYSGNPSEKYGQFRLTRFDHNLNTFLFEPKNRAVYTWEDGVLTRSFMRFGHFMTSELMYMHLQRRTMRVMDDLTSKLSSNEHVAYKILPGSFEALEVPQITAENFDSIVWRRRGDCIRHRCKHLRAEWRFWTGRIRRKLFAR